MVRMRDQTTVAVLKRMDRQKHDHENADGEKRMNLALAARGIEPCDEFGHQTWRIEWRRSLKNDTDLFSVFVERGDAVRRCLVTAAMPGVFLAVDEQVTVNLLDVVFGDGNVLPRVENRLHRLGIARDLLFVAGGEGFDIQIGKQTFDLAVR